MYTETKTCTKCKIEKPITEFYLPLFKWHCKECIKLYQRNHRKFINELNAKKKQPIDTKQLALIQELENKAIKMAIKYRYKVGKINIDDLISATYDFLKNNIK